MISTFDNYLAGALTTLAVKDDLYLNHFHGALGLCTEIGEILDAYKKAVYYNNDVITFDLKHLDVVNLGEELGDCLWYLAILAWYWEQDGMPMSQIVKASGEGTFKTIHAYEAALKTPELENISDLKKLKMLSELKTETDKLFDVSLSALDARQRTWGGTETLTKVLELLQKVCISFGISLVDVANINLKKLAKRYEKKGGIFSEACAKNRDLIKERLILEGA